MSSVTLNGKTYDSADFAGRGYKTTVTAGTGESLERWQAAFVDALADAGKALTTTSATELTIGTGSKVLTLAAERPYSVGAEVVIADTANPNTNRMFGTVTARSGTSLTVDVEVVEGSGTISAWTISLAGARGATGDVQATTDGTVSLPGIAWNADPDTGIYRAGTGEMRVASDGVRNITLLAASQAEAEAGTDDYKVMTALKTKQAIDALAGGGLVLLSEQTVTSASPVAAVDFTGAIDGTYDEYELHVLNAVPATDAVDLFLRASTDAGASFATSGYDWINSSAHTASSAATLIVASAGNSIKISGYEKVGSDSLEHGVSTVVNIIRPASSEYKKFFFLGSYVDLNARLEYFDGAGRFKSASAVNALRLLFSSGNIESGKFKLYGVKKS
jgi:hypothetical protein